MEEKKLEIVVFTSNINDYANEYTDRFKLGMSVESIKVDPLTCVYRHWSSTRYSMDGMPTANIFE